MTLEEIIKALPKRSQAKVARKAGVSSVFVHRVFKGEVESDKVLEAAIEIIAEKKRRRAELIEKFKEATSL